MEGISTALKRAAMLALPYLELPRLGSEEICKAIFSELWISAGHALEGT